MPRKQIDLTPMNKDALSVRDLKDAAKTLQGILQDFDRFVRASAEASENGEWTPEATEEFALRVLQVRDAYKID